MSFREDGQATLEWVARYLENRRELPVLARVEPGEIRARLPRRRPRRASRSRRCSPTSTRSCCRASRTGTTRASSPTSRSRRRRAGDPRRAADRGAQRRTRCSGGPRPPRPSSSRSRSTGCARLLGLPRGWNGTSRTPRRPRRCAAARDRARRRRSRMAAGPGACTARSTRTRRSTRPRRLLGIGLRQGAGSRRREYRMRPDAAAATSSRRRSPSSRRSARPRRPASIRCRRSPISARARGVWLHVDAAYAGSAAVCPEHPLGARRRRARRLARRQPAQVDVHADRLLGCSTRAARTSCATPSASSPSTCARAKRTAST